MTERITVLDVLTFQVALGIWVIGFICGFIAAVGLAQFLLYLRDKRDKHDSE